MMPFCLKLYTDYCDMVDKGEGTAIEDFAKDIGVAL